MRRFSISEQLRGHRVCSRILRKPSRGQNSPAPFRSPPSRRRRSPLRFRIPPLRLQIPPTPEPPKRSRGPWNRRASAGGRLPLNVQPFAPSFPPLAAQETVSPAQVGFSTEQVAVSRAKKPSRQPFLTSPQRRKSSPQRILPSPRHRKPSCHNEIRQTIANRPPGRTSNGQYGSQKPGCSERPCFCNRACAPAKRRCRETHAEHGSPKARRQRADAQRLASGERASRRGNSERTQFGETMIGRRNGDRSNTVQHSSCWRFWRRNSLILADFCGSRSPALARLIRL